MRHDNIITDNDVIVSLYPSFVKRDFILSLRTGDWWQKRIEPERPESNGMGRGVYYFKVMKQLVEGSDDLDDEQENK